MRKGSRTGVFLARRILPILFAAAASAVHAGNSADLAVTKTVDHAAPFVGDTVMFTVTLTNNGPNTATNVLLNDLLPVDLTFISATPSQGSYDSNTGVWDVGTVTTAAPQTLAIQVLIPNQNAATNFQRQRFCVAPQTRLRLFTTSADGLLLSRNQRIDLIFHGTDL